MGRTGRTRALLSSSAKTVERRHDSHSFKYPLPCQGDGKLYYGIYVLSGRIKGALKTTLRNIIEKYELPVRLTANQDIILCDISPSWKEEIEAAITAAGNPPPESVSPNLIKSIACPALPLCGLAIGEAERALEDIGLRVTDLLTSIGIEDGSILVRITG